MKFGLGYTKLALGSRFADEDLPNRIDVTANVGYSTADYSSYSGNVALRNIAGKPVDLLVGGSHYRYPEEDFFGLGQDSSEDNRTNYLMETSDFGVEGQLRPFRHVSFVGGASYLTPSIGSGKDDGFPSAEDFFDSNQLPGFYQQPDFLRLTAKAAYDWRDNPLHPHRGGYYGVTFANYQDRDLDLYDFRRYDIELQQYIPLPHRYRIIALRAAAVLTDADSDQQVPFYYMPTLGGHKDLRGFREFRFRDKNALMLTAEYRWEAWWALDGAFFIDAGQVAARRQDFKLDNMDVSYGFGLRFHSNKAFAFRLDFAFGKEGFIPMLRWENAF
jgi:outer membrane protein assembly factor BamA